MRQRVTLGDVLAPSALALLLFAGGVKASPAVLAVLPGPSVDLTVLGALLVAAAVVAGLFRQRLVLPAGALAVIGLWAAFAVGLFGPAPTAYASEKAARLFTLTLLAAVAPVFILRTRPRQWLWLAMLVLVGVVTAGLTAVRPGALAAGSDRLAAEGSNTIAAGRALGVALVVLCVLAGLRVVPRSLALPGIALFGWGTLHTGSRGPLLAAVIALVAVAALRAGDAWRRLRRLLGVSVALALALIAASRIFDGSFAVQRATGLQGSDGASVRVRGALWTEALRLIPERPFGVGWGGFGPHLPLPYRVELGAGRLYPHNVVLEVAVEAGWLAAVGLLVFAALGVWRLSRSADPRIGTTFTAVAVFFLVNAMVSGDVNDNRGMFAAIAMGWAVTVAAPRPAPEREAVAR